MRTAFIEQLTEEAKINDKIFLVVGDLGYSVVEKFALLFPDRFINVGIAEQNMAGVAAGLAMSGYNVYIYSIGNFPTLRCMEQIRNDIAYHQLNVKVIAVGGGYAYGSLGVSHYATEEIGMLRTIPNMVICAPGDPFETKAITSWSANYSGPVYMRLGKAGEPVVHDSTIEKIEAGMPLCVRNNSSNQHAVLSTGSMLKYVVDFVDQNEIKTNVFSVPFVKPLNKESYIRIFNTYDQIITIEEHQASGGMGSAILEHYHDLMDEGLVSSSPRFKRIAIPDSFISISGTQQYLREASGLVLKTEYFL